MICKTVGPESAARPTRSIRRGSMLFEMAIAAAMLSVAMVMTVKVLGYAGQQRRSAEQRQRAMLEVANLMERITGDPFDQVTAERARRLSISPAAASSLTSAELTVDVADEPRGPAPGRSARRVAIRLRWKGRSGEWEAPVRLTTWIERGRPSS
jgi:hypothetical protein